MKNIESLSPKIEIVSASPEDARGMQEVFYNAWIDTYPNEELGITVDDIEDRFKDAFTEDALTKRAERIANPAEGETLFLAKDRDKVVGLCRVIVYPDKNQLQAIYVLPEYQGKGIGKKLWAQAQQIFDPNKDTIVQVASYNDRAIDFYRKLGFEDIGKEWVDEKFKMKSGAVLPQVEMVIKAKNSQMEEKKGKLFSGEQ